MIAVIQRVQHAEVVIDGQQKSAIEQGFLVLLGIINEDNQEDIDWLSRKILNLRIFNDENGVMNRSLLDIDGELMVVSQFTLHASTKKGNRPSYIAAARPEVAIPLYESFVAAAAGQMPRPVKTGEFGADMKVTLLNDGPVTIIIDTKDRK